MSIPADSRPFERPSFFDGQRLTAADLTAVQAFTQRARWLHNQSLHDWGVALGLAVEARPGDRVVTVRPGYALDSEGRELVLGGEWAMAVPAIAHSPAGGEVSYHLTASYATDADLPPSETRAGVPRGRGAVRRPEAPRLRWQDPNDRTGEGRYRPGLDVVLATIRVRNCQLVAISMAERRHVEPATQPHVAAGETPAGDTPWEAWEEPEGRDDGAGRVLLGVQTRVDTTAAAFVSRPVYLANVIGLRRFSAIPGLEGGTGGVFPIDGFTHVVDPDRTGFTLRMLFPRGLVEGTDQINSERLLAPGVLSATLAELRSRLRWRVAWLGVEG